jgi:hypothetical protein
VKLTDEQLQEIHIIRRGKEYVDKEVAKKYKGNAIKTDLIQDGSAARRLHFCLEVP